MTKRLGLVGLVLAAVIAAPSMVSAQAYILQDDACVLIPTCETGARCPLPGTHAVTAFGGCFCAPGDAAAGVPALCCNAATGGVTCPSGMTCAFFTDASGGVCTSTATPYCGGDPMSVSRATSVIPCHTTPDGSFTPYWRSGDCDGDGVTNGMEALDPLRDPCCDDDAFCCHEAGRASAEMCCTIAAEPGACCAATGTDSISCCLAQSDFATCCDAASSISGDVTAVECCAADPAVTNPATCCEDAGLSGALCCEALSLNADQCCEAGVFCPPGDAGVPSGDAGVSYDAGAEPVMDGGTEPGTDGGPPPLPPDMVGFGGGGGCRCEVGARAPSAPLSLGLLAMGLVFVARSRRRS